MWLSTAYYISIVVPLYSIGLTLPTIIKSFATFTTPQIQLLTIPIYLVACAWVVICAILSDKMKKRFIFVLINQILALAGFVINITPAPYGLKYLGLMIGAMGAYGGLPSVVAWLGGNLMGQTKRGVGVGTSAHHYLPESLLTLLQRSRSESETWARSSRRTCTAPSTRPATLLVVRSPPLSLEPV